MKLSFLFVVVPLVFFISYVHAGCDESGDPDDGEVKAWFKNLGCKIQKGAGDLQESAKPYADKIGTAAKDFGSAVATKYDEIKHKLTDDDAPLVASSTPVYNAPTQKVPLAPLAGEGQAPAE